MEQETRCGAFSKREDALICDCISDTGALGMDEKTGIGKLKGIGEKTEALFNRLGIRTAGDLLRYYPRSYDVFEDPVAIGELEEGKTAAVTGVVFGPIQISRGGRLPVTTLHLKDLTGTLKVIWFRMPFLRSTLGKGGAVTLRGRVVRRRECLIMEHPQIYYPAARYDEKRHTMQPVYSLTAGLTNNAVIKAVKQALECVTHITDVLPPAMTEKYGLISCAQAVKDMHFPDGRDSFVKARERFVFEEFLVFILTLRRMKHSEARAANHFRLEDQPAIDDFLNRLPYRLTGAQQRVWEEIRSDMQGPSVMSRLVQGDVGSGKTVVALLALLLVGLNGCQGALMAPTEVLSRQHFENISGMLKTYGIPLEAVLLTGSMTPAQKREAYEKIENGSASIIIGTHALIQEKAVYKQLALVVTDEQHRFGVRQREALAGKGRTPHILVMSATPIPRTLAIILYGDLNISVIDEMPKNRLPIKNCVVDTSFRGKAYHFMRNQIEQGRQCYVICPMVEESESIEAENVQDYSSMLAEELGDTIRVGCLHGRMKQQEKDEVMNAFGRNEIQVLVSTTVVEVGIDVPNASVILIENAERFGLAQLHQLRGRVGRGKHQSYCIFMSSSKSKESKARLEILNKSNDGFYIAGEDLRLRGPGDLFGIRQSGILDFRLADVFQDAKLLQLAARAADEIITEDPELQTPVYDGLKKCIDSKMRQVMLETTL